MKKLSLLFALLFLVACNGEEASDETITTCRDGERVVIIEGFEEEIVRFTVSITLTRSEFNADFLQGAEVNDEDIRMLFSDVNQLDEGITFRLARLTGEYAVIEMTYDYGMIPSDELAQMWGVPNFEDAITLSAVIASLENGSMQCEIVAVAHEEGTEALEEETAAPTEPLTEAPTEPETEAETEPEVVLPTIGFINSDWVNFMRHPGFAEIDIIITLFADDQVTIVDLYYNDYWASVAFETDVFSEVGALDTLHGFVLREFINAQ